MGYKDDNYSSRVCNHHPETCTCRDWDINETPKQDTLEEASEMFISKYYSGEGYERDIEEAIKFGAKWMEEEMEKLKDFDTWKEWKNKN